MKGFIKRTISGILCGVMILSVGILASCDKKKDSGEDDNGPLKVISDNASDYVIVRAEEADSLERKAAIVFRNKIKEKTGVELTIVTDDKEAAAHEIVVGQTNREEAAGIVRETFQPNATYVAVSGEKLFITGYSSDITYAVVERRTDKWLDSSVEKYGTVCITDELAEILDSGYIPSQTLIRVMTQNLCNFGEGVNTPAMRSKRFKKIVLKYRPDIVGVNEVNSYWYNYLLTTFDDYKLVSVSKKDFSNSLLINSNRFEVVETDVKWLTDTPDVDSQYSKYVRTCFYAVLKEKSTGKEFVVFVAHLDWNDVAVKNVDALTKIMKPFVDKGLPVYLMGDLNNQRGGEWYKPIDELLDDSHTDAAVTVKQGDTYNGFGTGTGEIDFIFHAANTPCISYEVLNYKETLVDGTIGYVSDHNAVLCSYYFN